VTDAEASRISARLRSYALRRVDESVVDDLVQATWVAALEGASSFRGEASVVAWCVSILRRKIADHYRAASRRPHVELTEDIAIESIDEFRIDRERAVAFARQAIEGLPRRCRQAIASVDLQDKSHADVAAAMGVSSGGVRVFLHRGRSAVREELTQKGHLS
jgi:RNA polymerase sigma-70 factor (ECF subfamily)